MARSTSEILSAVIDGEIATKEQAQALLADESSEARAEIRRYLTYAAQLCPARHAENLRKWFDLGESDEQ